MASRMSGRPVPRATYRLQLNKDFPFGRAAELAPYLGELGISHVYLSPVLKARRGSTHGYDTVDHSILNPELGTRSDFEDMVAAFRRSELGVVLDIVPNHVGIGGDENELWLDVLRWGAKSRYADWFDINWSPSEPGLRNKVLVPLLGSSFGDALERGALELRRDAVSGDYAIWAEGAHKLPVCPETYHLIDGPGALERINSPGGRDELVRLVAAQNWRPARFSVAADDINYRRFFIVSDLAGIRVERDEVFRHVHGLIFELVGAGLVDGLRVDHIDGLYDPKGYCLKLRRECPRDVYLVVEKILAPHESLRQDWEVDGTTGYEFATAVNQLLTDPDGEAALTQTYERFAGSRPSFEAEERDAKRRIIDYEMAAELDALTVRLGRLAASSLRTADLTRNAIRSALREVVAAMPVYRTYVDGGPLADTDQRNIAFAVANAREATPALDPAVFDFLGEALTAELCRAEGAYDPADTLDGAMRVQQYTGPVMAKGLEDTALYRYNRLIALSDVGAKPDRFGLSVAAFHDFNRSRLAAFPHCMLTSSSHDTKRGEDARARIAALSGYMQEWADAVAQWLVLLQEVGAPQLDPNDVYYFFQLLLGSWPVGLSVNDEEAVSELRRRMDAAMLKSVREARMRTNWAAPNTTYEDAVARFVKIALTPGPFLSSFLKFEGKVARAGAQNGIVETVLKLTVPGVPDIYRGAEFWEQSMVDPDNRLPVDFAARASALGNAAGGAASAADWQSGRVKQRVIADILALRREQPRLFSHGSYEPLPAGAATCAFVRRHQGMALLVAVNLHPWRERPAGQDAIVLPDGMAWASLRPAVGEVPEDGSNRGLFRHLPAIVAVCAG